MEKKIFIELKPGDKFSLRGISGEYIKLEKTEKTKNYNCMELTSGILGNLIAATEVIVGDEDE